MSIECYQTVNGKVHCALHCPNGYDHSKLNPDSPLNTWEEEIRKGDVWIDMENIEVIIEFIKKVEALAIQKEREDQKNKVLKLKKKITWAYPKGIAKKTTWVSLYDVLHVNKGGEDA